ncbi:MAG: sialidase [Gammaproteobacteria bacterium]|nr:sialidase [Gammaproteobacteria bacterium]
MNHITKFAVLLSMLLTTLGLNARNDVLQTPAKASQLAEQSVLIDVIKYNDHFLAVGERGHVINWRSPGEWQQEKSPVSVLLTAVTTLSDGTKVAVGHDSAIIVCPPDSDQWVKVFDGYNLLDLKASFFEEQITNLQTQIAAAEDPDQIEDLEFTLEEFTFGLEDIQAEKEDGPNKPLLSIAATADNQIFAVGAYGTLLYSNDKGVTWSLQEYKLDNPDRFHLNSVISTADNKLYIAGENSTAFVSSDSGASWQRMNMPYQGSMFGIAAQENSSNLVAFGLQGNIMVSNDSGESWQLKRIDTSGSFQGGVIASDGTAYIVGHGGTVIDFNVNNIEDINIRKHPSGAAFAKPLVHQDALILVGQYGIISWPLSKEKE